MKIERIDEKTVRCFLSNEELEGYQIDYKDFVMRSEKAREVVREIIEQATEEVGYKPPKFAFDMSIMMMPDQGLVLTFSESDPLEEQNGGKLMEYLREMKNALQKSAGNLSAAENPQPGQGMGDASAEAGMSTASSQPINRPERGIFCFSHIADVMALASAVPRNLRVHSELYAMNGRYYLYVQKGTASYQRYSKLCIQAMEFGGLFGADEQKYCYLQEHGECLIRDHALRKLHVEKESSAGRQS